jgi:hypothetical protein
MASLRRRPPANPPSLNEAFAAVAAALWSERETLDLLQFRMVTQRGLLRAGVGRWLGLVDDEIRAAVLQLRTAELVRAAEVEVLRELLGLSAYATLDEIVAASPPAWALVLAETRDSLRALVAEIESGLEESRRLLAAAADASRHSLDQLPRAAGSIGAARVEELGDLTTSELAMQLASTSACYDAALQTAEAISAPSLREFLF